MIKLKVVTNVEKFENDFYDLVCAFDPLLVFDKQDGELLFVECINNGYYQVKISYRNSLVYQDSKEREDGLNELLDVRAFKRFAKRSLYIVLKDLAGVELPYGSLTGIRPTKIYYDLLSENKDPKRELSEYYLVSDKKIELLSRIIETQKGIYSFGDGYDAFANIPVCPTRCAYCSFIAETYSHAKKHLEKYAENVNRDISTQFSMDLGNRRAIYVGGGTPTAIDDKDLQTILSAFRSNGEEFTVEAGRPETFTKEKARILKDNGVTRISINPQTFKESTLSLIGRSHTVADIYQAYERAKNYDFDVNMDLIAMLPEESVQDFINSVDTAISLEPANITVHTLSVKRGSTFNYYGMRSDAVNDAFKMVDYAYSALTQNGYSPYYTYRQKNTFGRLENVGYAKPKKACVYNVDIMEETHTVHASGAGAISKTVCQEVKDGASNIRIERLSEIKEVKGYNERIDELIQKKFDFFAKR